MNNIFKLRNFVFKNFSRQSRDFKDISAHLPLLRYLATWWSLSARVYYTVTMQNFTKARMEKGFFWKE